MTDPHPHPLGSEKRHYWLAVTMARKTGADMQRALEDGVISHDDWATLVQRCRGCGWAEGCNHWMTAQDAGAADVPTACPNADVFDRVLKALAPA
jgi:hypothetical protein